MKMANSFWGEGEGRGVSEEVETLGEAPPLLIIYIDYQGQSKTMIYYTVFLFRDPPPPPSFWIRPCPVYGFGVKPH